MAIKNIGELGLDEITEDYLMAECEDMGAELGVDTHQGSVYMDACSGHIIRTCHCKRNSFYPYLYRRRSD